MNKFIKAAAIAAAVSAFHLTAYAEDLSNIQIKVVEDKAEPGVPYEVYVNAGSSKYEVTDVEISKPYEEWHPGYKVSYEVTVEPTEGNRFKPSAEAKVSGSNTSYISKKVRSDSATIRFNYIPKMMLPAPENIYYEDDMYAVWDKVNSAKYEVKIYKENEDGEFKSHKTVTVNKPEIDLMDYVTDGSAATFEVRAVAKDKDKEKYILDSEWVSADDITSSSYIGGNSEGWVNGTNGTYYYTNSNNKKETGWKDVNGIWYYFDPNNNGAAITASWAFIDNNWFYFNNEGIMQTGWIYVNGLWYYMNTNHDGTYGRMLTGWIRVGGEGSPCYYLNPDPNNGRVYGAMYANEMTPDGRWVDESGAAYF